MSPLFEPGWQSLIDNPLEAIGNIRAEYLIEDFCMTIPLHKQILIIIIG